MRKIWYLLAVGLASINVLAQAQNPTLKVKIEATQLDREMLVQKLNQHGADHGLHFGSTDESFDYRIVFATGQEKYPLYGGAVNSSGASVHVYRGDGVELFAFNRSGRWTDKGAANAAAKEIIKRILRLRELEAGTKR